MRFSWTRVGAILRKELRDYRRNRFVIVTMTMVPVAFIIAPMIQLFVANATADTAHLDTRIGLSLLYMLVIPAIVPSTLSACSVVGEREQGTLEPVLTTPIHREEFLIGKALAAFVPALVIAYMVFGIFLAAAALFAHPVIASAIYAGPHVLVQLLFTPLLAGWAIWVGIAVSARSTDVRVAQQLGALASLPPHRRDYRRLRSKPSQKPRCSACLTSSSSSDSIRRSEPCNRRACRSDGICGFLTIGDQECPQH